MTRVGFNTCGLNTARRRRASLLADCRFPRSTVTSCGLPSTPLLCVAGLSNSLANRTTRCCAQKRGACLARKATCPPYCVATAEPQKGILGECRVVEHFKRNKRVILNTARRRRASADFRPRLCSASPGLAIPWRTVRRDAAPRSAGLAWRERRHVRRTVWRRAAKRDFG